MKKDKIYLAGKVTGDPCYKMKFEAGVKHLEHLGWKRQDIVNPGAGRHAVAEGYVALPWSDETLRMGGDATRLERKLRSPDREIRGPADLEMDNIHQHLNNHNYGRKDIGRNDPRAEGPV